MSSEHAVETEQIFRGSDFAEARALQGVSLEQLSRELRLPIRTLEAIEAGRLEGLGGPVFVRGYIRAYARRLRLDPERYVLGFDRSVGIAEVAARVRAVGTVSTSPARQSRFLMRFGSFVFIVGILATVVWWWQTQYSLEGLLPQQSNAPVTVDTADGNTLVLPTLNDPAPTDPAVQAEIVADAQATASAATEVVPVAPEPPPALVSLELPAVGLPPVTDQLPAAGAQPVEAEAAASETAETPVAGLQIGLSDDSWLSIKDAKGASLFNGIAKAGAELTFEGQEPLTVVIGKADAVSRIQYAGKSVDLSAVSSKNVARLKLPQ